VNAVISFNNDGYLILELHHAGSCRGQVERRCKLETVVLVFHEAIVLAGGRL
jgi:hypothetical protein